MRVAGDTWSSERDPDQILPESLWREDAPTDNLLSDSWPPTLLLKIHCFKPPVVWYLGPRKLTLPTIHPTTCLLWNFQKQRRKITTPSWSQVPEPTTMDCYISRFLSLLPQGYSTHFYLWKNGTFTLCLLCVFFSFVVSSAVLSIGCAFKVVRTAVNPSILCILSPSLTTSSSSSFQLTGIGPIEKEDGQTHLWLGTLALKREKLAMCEIPRRWQCGSQKPHHPRGPFATSVIGGRWQASANRRGLCKEHWKQQPHH